jgi:hypothetical protein
VRSASGTKNVWAELPLTIADAIPPDGRSR